LDIFKFIGPPAILQPDNGREFSGIARKELGEEDVTEVRMFLLFMFVLLVLRLLMLLLVLM
jgi:hypothetical protein